MSAGLPRLGFVVPADLERPTGGNRYDQALARALAELGVDVDLRRVPGSWPDASAAARARLADRLAGRDPVLVDGLLACGAPDEIAAATGRGCEIAVLVHMPLALDTGLPAGTAADRDSREQACLRAATTVITTSAWAAAELRRRHGPGEIVVATPGADRAAPAVGSTPPVVRQLATVSPVKDQLTVVAALAGLRRIPWTAELTGDLTADPGYVRQVRTAIAAGGLADRVRLTGPLTGDDLQRAWHRTDLLVLPSRAETWGMVVTEALARGIPAVVTRGTGAVEALGHAPGGDVPGAVVPAGEPRALASAIRRLLGEGREVARRAALARRDTVAGWRDTARVVSAALSRDVGRGGRPLAVRGGEYP